MAGEFVKRTLMKVGSCGKLGLSCVLLLVGASLLAFAGCGSKPAPKPQAGDPLAEPEKLRVVKLQLNWRAEAEHGGYFAALAAGYYEQEGIDLRIQPGGPNVGVIQEVARGDGMFGIATADQILTARAAGANVIALMAPMQDSPRCVMVHEESGVTKLEDLKDVTLAVRPGISFFEFLKTKIPLTNVNVVNYSGTIAQFLDHEDYAQQAYVFSEPYLAEQQGAKVRSLMVSDLGYNPYTSLLFTRENRLTDDPELVAKMTRASVRGWQKYLEDPAAANALIQKSNPEISTHALEYGAKAIKPLCLPHDADPKTIGTMSLDRWQELRDQLVAIKLLKPGKVQPAEVFTTKYLP
jgi:NitT/TauT family transport system substrate-binding protein